MGGGRILGLDGLRGVAAIMVMLMHARIDRLAAYGHLAVDLFFILSGYVIAQSYEPALRDGLKIGKYMQARLARLYPMLFLGSLAGLAVQLAGLGDFDLRGVTLLLAIVGQFLLIPFIAHHNAFALNGPQWSITYELAINYLHALLRPWLSLRALAAIVGLSAAALALTLALKGNLRFGVIYWEAHIGLIRVSFGFFGGVLLYRLRERWRERVPQYSFAIPAIMLAGALCMPPQWISSPTAVAVFEFVCVVLLFPALVMIAANARAGGFAAALGTLSYPLYAIHMPVMGPLHKLGASSSTKLLACCLLIVAAWAIGHWLDEPLNRWRKARARAPLGQPVSAAPCVSPV